MSALRRNVLRTALFVASLPLRLIPAGLRVGLIRGLIVADSRIGSPENAVRRAFRVEDIVQLVLAERATATGSGEHPKHRLMRYHDFFVDHIEDGGRVIDVGCGYGAVARTLATKLPRSDILGIDIEQKNIAQAQAVDNPKNLTFMEGDALKVLPDGPWDVVVLSNILEHIEARVAFLRRLGEMAQPKKVLIRVPAFERHWHIPYRKELGLSYFSDETHFIEHTIAEFREELDEAAYTIDQLDVRWGEIWAVCRPPQRFEAAAGSLS